MAQKRAILFDLFFTLIDPLKDELFRESEYAVLDMERSEFEQWNEVDYDLRASGKIRGPYNVFRHIVRGRVIDEALLLRAADARLERIRRALCGVEEQKLALLKKLRKLGFRICLVSNADDMDKHHWQDSPLRACFDQTIFSCDAGLLKPDPRIYRLALERLGLEPAAERLGQCIYVGDGGHEELRGAGEAGMTTVLTTEYITQVWPEKIPALRQNADYEVARLEDILPIINDCCSKTEVLGQQP
ncbi:MAG: HAD family hydrolase [Treponema sp.]|jgi:putative hydrolase of the HAD superfamily|nr:HAD family hydrolase [Treponema sp.]